MACAIAGPARAAAASPPVRAGVQLHLMWNSVDDAEMDRQLDLVQESGAAMIRVDVGWASLQQTSRDAYEGWFLRKLDRVVAGARARDIQLLLTFMNSPCWASTAPESLKQGCAGAWWDRGVQAYTPSDPQDYARALAFLAARYEGRVAAWEIWNEPNLEDYYRAADPAASYAALVKAAYPAAKAADPSATIVAGALSQSDHAFTQRLYSLGIKGSFDAFSIHPYSDDVSPLDRRDGVDARYSFIRGVPAVHDVMVANGDRKPLWLSESGWSTATVRTPDHWRNGVSEDTQARFLLEQARQVRAWDYVPVNITYEIADRGGDRAAQWDNCGLRRVDGSAKPAWATFREAAATLQADTSAGDPVDPGAGGSGTSEPGASEPGAGEPQAPAPGEPQAPAPGGPVAGDPVGAPVTGDGAPAGGAPAAGTVTGAPAPGAPAAPATPAAPARPVNRAHAQAAPARRAVDRARRALSRARSRARAATRTAHGAHAAQRHPRATRRVRAARRDVRAAQRRLRHAVARLASARAATRRS